MKFRDPNEPFEESPAEIPDWEDGINPEDGEAFMAMDDEILQAYRVFEDVFPRAKNPENLKEELMALEGGVPRCMLVDAILGLAYRRDPLTPIPSAPTPGRGGMGWQDEDEA